MKIKTCEKSYDEVMSLPRPEHVNPKKPALLWRTVMRLAGVPDLQAVKFSYTKKDMEKAGKGPWLILMNHSSFLDLEIAARVLYPQPYQIVCTSDGFVGKEKLMRDLGCIPTQKFVSDIGLIADIKYALTENRCHVLMYPEASYSFDGTATPLPRKLGVLLKNLKVPVVMLTTFGAFARDPLYNNLQKRKLKVRAELACLLTPEDIAASSVEELDKVLDRAFSFDYFRWQKEEKIEIREPFRADGLERILYKCPHCGAEGKAKGAGTRWTCSSCGAAYELGPLGDLSRADAGPGAFTHIPDWYAWERSEVRRELEEGSYKLDETVDIGLIVDHQALYMVGKGRLIHDREGFLLTGCEGKLRYSQGPLKCYSLYADYFWYEIGDVLCLGDKECLYYCFPEAGVPVAKTRLATEELYKMNRRRR